MNIWGNYIFTSFPTHEQSASVAESLHRGMVQFTQTLRNQRTRSLSAVQERTTAEHGDMIRQFRGDGRVMGSEEERDAS